MLATRELPRALLRRGVPLRTRAGLVVLAVRRRLRPAETYFLRVGAARVPISHADYGVDWKTMHGVLVERAYAFDYRGAVVVDIGAHKGCYGAYALARGARAVVSYEPEETNYGYLEECAAGVRAAGGQWHTHRAAVAAHAGTAELHVMRASWGHALAPSAAAEGEVGVQRVATVTMADVLAEAGALAGTGKLVVKVNAEGAECDIVLGTSTASWERADAMLMEVHSWAPCTLGELVSHLEGAGLATLPPGEVDWVHRLAR
ncbi:MAG TPA: FkbM family methyltransferase [Gaiellaceae bacterium]|nr:FkbM family methyltransferase [Gaiellaceae bacterium]